MSGRGGAQSSQAAPGMGGQGSALASKIIQCISIKPAPSNKASLELNLDLIGKGSV